ncbi:hypothetical protein GX441_02965 [bacterium]|nr:hypothetical protein [bacterium]
MPGKTIAFLLGVLFLSSLSNAQTMGVGGRADAFSSGIELRFMIPVGDAKLFIAPNGLGAYYFGDSTGTGFYNFGLRTGFMFKPEEWLSPYLGIGGGYSFSSYSYSSMDVRDSAFYSLQEMDSYENYGGRIFAGLSFAPFRLLSGDIKWLKPLDNLRFEFDSGLMCDIYSQKTVQIWTDSLGVQQPPEEYSSNGQRLIAPDLGVGLVFTW